jgi:hypothetical protein
MGIYSTTDIHGMVGRDLGTSNATLAVKIEGSSTTLTTTNIKIKDSFVSNVTNTYNSTGSYLEIDNQGLETITLSVGSINIPIKAGYIFYNSFEEFTSFTITVPTTCDYIVLVGGA